MNYVELHVRWAVPAVMAIMLGACAASKPQVAPPPPPPLDASYDWHVLLIAPFGSVLKDIPLAVHEVLVFRDEAHSESPAGDPECYAVSGTGPRFLRRSPSSYLLCFNRGKLSRIEATVRLPEKESAQVVADACDLWTKNAHAPNTAASAGPERAQGSAAPEDSAACEGADDGIAFAAHIEREPNEEDAQLTVRLDAADPAADR